MENTIYPSGPNSLLLYPCFVIKATRPYQLDVKFTDLMIRSYYKSPDVYKHIVACYVCQQWNKWSHLSKERRDTKQYNQVIKVKEKG